MSDAAPPRGRRFPDPDCRWRGIDVARMQACADAVFALVPALRFLRATPAATIGDLEAAMKGLLPFAVTFLMLAMVLGGRRGRRQRRLVPARAEPSA